MANPVSGYFPSLQLRPDAESAVRRLYIDPMVNRFFSRRDVSDPYEIEAADALYAEDYKVSSQGGVEFSYFYEVLFDSINKKNGEISYVAYALTLDEELTPKTCDQTGIQHGVVCLADEPVLYYLLVRVQKVLSVIKQRDFPADYPRTEWNTG